MSNSQVDDRLLIEKILNPTAQRIDLHSVLNELYEKIRDIKRQSKPSKAAQTYADEEEQKLLYIQDVLKQCLWEVYANDPDIVSDTITWGQIMKNFDIEVIVRRKNEVS